MPPKKRKLQTPPNPILEPGDENEDDPMGNNGAGDADASGSSNTSPEKNRGATRKAMKEIRQKLTVGDCEAVTLASLKPPGTKLSPLWQHFKVVRHSASKILCQAAVCMHCGKVLAYHDRRTRTSNLSRHSETCTPAQASRSVNVEPPKDAKDDFKIACAHFCAMGLRPPEIFNDGGMVILIQKALDIGAAYADLGRLDAKRLMPCPTTVKTCMEEEAKKAQEQTANDVLPAIREFRCAATTDAYTDDHKKEKYVALTLHYLDNWTMKNRLLFIAHMTEAATSGNLLQTIEENFQNSGVHPNLMQRLKFITDAGSDIKKALEMFQWFYCMAHALNIVLKTALSVKYAVLIGEMLDSSQEAASLVEKANTWVREARTRLPKGCHLLEKLKCSNPQSQGHLPALRSVDLYLKKVQNAAGDGPTAFTAVELEAVKELGEFLTPFDLDGKRESSPQISPSRYPCIKKHMAQNDTDSDMVRAIKESESVRRVLLPMKLITVIEACKEVVTMLKRTGLSNKLEHTAKQEVPTRWNSITDMLLSLDKEWEKIKELTAGNKSASSKVNNVDIGQVKALIKFLSPFAKCTDKLQGENYPTLPYALLSFESLLSHCATNSDDDDEALAEVRAKAYSLLCEKVLIKEDHKIAVFLCPLLKHLSVCSTEAERKEVHDAVRRRLKKIMDRDQASAPPPSSPPPLIRLQDESSSSTGTMADDESESTPPATQGPSRAALLDTELFGSFLLQAPIGSPCDEVDQYRDMSALEAGAGGQCNSVDPLQWWKTLGVVRFPNLSKLAMEVLASPATSAPSERVFSDLTELLDDLRTSMQPQTVSNTLVLRDFLRTRS